jgi:hypothetical protein
MLRQEVGGAISPDLTDRVENTFRRERLYHKAINLTGLPGIFDGPQPL